MNEVKTTLHTLSAEMNLIVQQIVEAGGELTPELEVAYTGTSLALKDKADAYGFIMDKLDAESDFWKSKADQYLKVSKSCSSLKARMNESIKIAMKTMDVTEVEGEDIRFKLSNSAPKLVIDEEMLPSIYKMAVTELVPDKTKIKEDLNHGVPVIGAKLEEVFSLRKYVNSKKGK